MIGHDDFASSQFSDYDLKLARAHYEIYHELPIGTATNVQLSCSSAGVAGWLSWNPDCLLKVGKEVHSPSLCGMWAKGAVSVVASLPEWERVVLTVDSGAAETVIPPSVARNLPLLHSSLVGTEYEVANGGVIINLGEKRAEVVTKLGNAVSMLMNFQVVKVHKPLLAVS